MSQDQESTGYQGSDPRLLLPEWLRDPQVEVESSLFDQAAPDTASVSAKQFDSVSSGSAEAETTQSGPIPVIEEDPRGVEQTRTSPTQNGSGWQAPPLAVETYDPAGLISSDDLPSWVRSLAVGRQNPLRPDPGQVPATAFGLAAAAVLPGGSLQQATIQQIDRPTTEEMESHAEARSARTASDLTPTRFILLAGTTLLLIILALGMLFLQ